MVKQILDQAAYSRCGSLARRCGAGRAWAQLSHFLTDGQCIANAKLTHVVVEVLSPLGILYSTKKQIPGFFLVL